MIKIAKILLLWVIISVSDANEIPVIAPFYFPPGLKEGERGSAICTIKSGDRPFEFQWMKDGNIVNESSNIKIQSVLDSSFLVIEAVRSESSGNYTCIVKNSYGTDRFVATLAVTAPPVWVQEPTDALAQEGESLTIDCTASGVPSPTIKWKSGESGNDVLPSDPSASIRVTSSGSLVINRVEARMKGIYTCEADNGFGLPLQKTISISVRDPPFVAPFNFPPGLKEGEQGSATCTIRSGDRPVEFKWLKDDKEMTESSSVRMQSPGDYSILLIQSVVPESSGNYTCIVRNAYGSDRFTATLTVSAPPVWVKEPRDILAQEGDSISFDCLAEGEPKPSVKWFRGAEKSEIVSDNVIGMSISSSGSLVVSKVVYSMQDSYTCVADNGLGKPLSQTVSLSVRDAPVVAPFVFPPAFKEGERGSVICTIRSGDRPVEFNWRKDGNTLSPSSSVDIQLIKDSSILVIESVTSKSSGNYTCVVSNAFGKDQFTATLIVTAPPQWIKEPMNTISQEGENVIIDCEASGVPPPAIKWISSSTKEQVSKDASSAVRISEAGSLIINRVEASMHGSYACEADNGFGEPLRKEILISVRGELKA
ncbi:Titin like protein [Argiope bruennichi]|uniref:Titin like protein n=1 Tax=Argiope bruennichi TaxID=94029 RepID=A0A8T0FQ77_ARGBR|nr:Titin like protein [Argiope bruennichi]